MSSNATSSPWPGAEGLLGVLLEVDFVRDNASLEKSFGLGLMVILPDEKDDQHRTRLPMFARERRISNIPIVNVRSPDHLHGPPAKYQSSRKAFVASIHNRLLVGEAPASSQATNLVPTHTA